MEAGVVEVKQGAGGRKEGAPKCMEPDFRCAEHREAGSSVPQATVLAAYQMASEVHEESKSSIQSASRWH